MSASAFLMVEIDGEYLDPNEVLAVTRHSTDDGCRVVFRSPERVLDLPLPAKDVVERLAAAVGGSVVYFEAGKRDVRVF